MLTVAALLFGAKLVAAAKEMAVAWRYGISAEIDAYLLAFTIVSWVPVMIASVGTVVFVPRLVGLVGRPAERSQFVSELNGAFVVLGSVAALLPFALGSMVVGLVAGNLSAGTQRQTMALMLQMAPVALLMVCSGYLAIRLQAREKQGYNFLEAMPALGIFSFVLFAPEGLDAGPLVWGTLVGAVLQLTWGLRMVRGADSPFGNFAFRHRSPHWQTAYAAVGVMALGQLVLGFSTPIDQFYAARVGEGAIATFGYANRVVSLATGLGAVAIARALLPVLSEAAAKGEWQLGYRHATRWSLFMLVAGALAVSVGWLLAPWAVEVLFERGAFGAENTRQVAHALRIGLFQLPFFFSGIVLVQWIVARRSYRFLLITAIVAVVSKVVLNEMMLERLGLDAVMYATAGMYAISWLLQLLFLWRDHAGADPE